MDSFLSAPCEKLLPSHNLTTDLEIEIFGHYLNFFGCPKIGVKYIRDDKTLTFFLMKIICVDLICTRNKEITDDEGCGD